MVSLEQLTLVKRADFTCIPTYIPITNSRKKESMISVIAHIQIIIWCGLWTMPFTDKKNQSQQTFIGLQDVLNTSSRYFWKTFWRCLQSKVSCITTRKISILPKHHKDVLKKSWRCLEDVLKTSWTPFENVLRTSWRCLEDVLENKKLWWLRKTFF